MCDEWLTFRQHQSTWAEWKSFWILAEHPALAKTTFLLTARSAPSTLALSHFLAASCPLPLLAADHFLQGLLFSCSLHEEREPRILSPTRKDKRTHPGNRYLAQVESRSSQDFESSDLRRFQAVHCSGYNWSNVSICGYLELPQLAGPLIQLLALIFWLTVPPPCMEDHMVEVWAPICLLVTVREGFSLTTLSLWD